MSENSQPTAEQLEAQIKTWAMRAEMARQQGNTDLTLQALERKTHYENALARLQEFNVSES